MAPPELLIWHDLHHLTMANGLSSAPFPLSSKERTGRSPDEEVTATEIAGLLSPLWQFQA